MTDQLHNRLLASAPAPDDGDWGEVRRRAGVIAGRRRKRQLLAAAAVFAAGAALVVTPAFGLGERLLNWAEGDPAPSRVKEAFLAESRPTRLVVGERVVFERRQPPPDLRSAKLGIGLQSSVGPVYLWIAPAGGAACTLLEIDAVPDLPDGRLNASPDCGSMPQERAVDFGIGATQARDGYFSYVQGQVRDDVAALEVMLSNGERETLRLVDGFFLAELPWYTLAERRDGCDPPLGMPDDADPESTPCFVRPASFRVFDRRGDLIAVETLPPPPPMHRPIEAYRQVASLRLKSGRTVRAEVARGDGGTLCYQVIWGPSAGGCGRIPRNALPSMMVSGSGAQQLVLLHGAVGQAIETVELVHDDGEVERLRIQNGYVLKQIDPDGPSPARIVGRDPQGKVVADRSAWGPG